METNQSNDKINWGEIYTSLKAYVADVISLNRGVNKKATIAEIKNKKSMSGANAWMLMCSIVIASIGLSQDSQAVIIGAMLISPLMSPILGIGLAVGINDRSTLFKSLQHLGMAVIITLVTSTIYFYFTPFGDITPEIEARTEPTFLDIIIAIFGGIAGIVSIARKDISTTLPGVAIATALMPPLCVTGFGLAKGNWGIASTSFYLFFLNTFFVALSTYLVIKLLKFPLKEYVNKTDRKRNFYTVAIISTMAIIPSLMIFRDVWHDVRIKNQTKKFIEEYIGEDQIYLDEYEIVKSDTIDFLILKVYGNHINESRLSEYNEGCKKLGLKNISVQIIPTSEVDLSDVTSLETKISSIERIAIQLEAANKEREEDKEIIMYFEGMNIDTTLFRDVSAEIKAIFPDLNEIGISKIQKTNFESFENSLPLAILQWNSRLRSSAINSNQERVEAYLRERLDLDTIVLLSY